MKELLPVISVNPDKSTDVRLVRFINACYIPYYLIVSTFGIDRVCNVVMYRAIYWQPYCGTSNSSGNDNDVSLVFSNADFKPFYPIVVSFGKLTEVKYVALKQRP